MDGGVSFLKLRVCELVDQFGLANRSRLRVKLRLQSVSARLPIRSGTAQANPTQNCDDEKIRSRAPRAHFTSYYLVPIRGPAVGSGDAPENPDPRCGPGRVPETSRTPPWPLSSDLVYRSK